MLLIVTVSMMSGCKKNNTDVSSKLNKSDIDVNVSLIDITRYFVEELPEANMQTRFTACCMLRLFADKTDINERLLYLDTECFAGRISATSIIRIWRG